MKKSKLVFVICSVVALVALLTIAFLIKGGRNVSQESFTDTGAISSSQADADSDDGSAQKSYVWYKEPFLDATEVKAITDAMCFDTVYRYTDTQYVAYYNGYYCGLADSRGKLLTDPLYSNAQYCPERQAVALDNHFRIYNPEAGAVEDHGGHGGGYPEFYYDISSGSYVMIGGGEGEIEAVAYDKAGVYITQEAYLASTGSYTFEGTEYFYYDIVEKGRLGLYNNGQLVIPFEYVAAADISDGTVAMYDGEMWTYFTVDGKEIMKNVAPNNDTFQYYADDTLVREMAVFSFSEGCVPVKKDGKWGYMNKDGKMIIDADFDYALPVYESRAWVLSDGLWGIIEITV